jgi:Na+/H+ antiporter NhaD/arsenite permease-like protein
MDLTSHWSGIAALSVFVIAYGFVVTEEFTRIKKSAPVILAAGLIWVIIGIQYAQAGLHEEMDLAIRTYLTEFAELFLFLLAAMTYVNAMSERCVFDALRGWLTRRRISLRGLFWMTGVISFFLSALIDNLTTALVMGGVIIAVGGDNKRFVSLCCVNVVVAANAGGAFSPFGDITTLMVWQRGLVEFREFLTLFVPSTVNYLIPAFLMSLTIKDEVLASELEPVEMRRGARRIMALFILTIALAVSFRTFIYLPPFLGMVTGLACLQLFGYYLRRTHVDSLVARRKHAAGDIIPFDSFRAIARAEWDTLLFFFGVIMAVGGLAFIGYLEYLSGFFYSELGPTITNVFVGIASAIVDNIPVMVAVLQMNPTMNLEQWLLVTLTAGVGGSMLSIGSAAGVALMGQARGHYTFFSHLRWAPVIAIGYGLSIWVHLLLYK